jgi:hypothetical protein
MKIGDIIRKQKDNELIQLRRFKLRFFYNLVILSNLSGNKKFRICTNNSVNNKIAYILQEESKDGKWIDRDFLVLELNLINS